MKAERSLEMIRENLLHFGIQRLEETNTAEYCLQPHWNKSIGGT